MTRQLVVVDSCELCGAPRRPNRRFCGRPCAMRYVSSIRSPEAARKVVFARRIIEAGWRRES